MINSPRCSAFNSKTMNLGAPLTVSELWQILSVFLDDVIIIPGMNFHIENDQIVAEQSARATIRSTKRKIQELQTNPKFNSLMLIFEKESNMFLTFGSFLSAVCIFKGFGVTEGEKELNFLTPLQLREVNEFLSCLKPETVICPGYESPEPYYRDNRVINFKPTVTTTVEVLSGLVQKTLAEPIRFQYGLGSQAIDSRANVRVSNQRSSGKWMTLDLLLRSIETWIKIGEGKR